MYVTDIIDALVEPVLIDDTNLFPYLSNRVDYAKYRAMLLKFYRYCIKCAEDDTPLKLHWADPTRLPHVRTSSLPHGIITEISELKRMALQGKKLPVTFITKVVTEFARLIEEGPLTTSTEHLLYKLKWVQYNWRHYIINSVKADPNTTEITNINGVSYWLIRDPHNKLVLGNQLNKTDVFMRQAYQLKFEVLSYLVLNFHTLTPEDQFVLTPITTVNKSFCRR